MFRGELRTEEYPSPQDIDQARNTNAASWLFSPWAKRIGVGGSIVSGGMLTACTPFGGNTLEPTPTIAIVQEQTSVPAVPTAATISITEIARAMKRADGIRFAVQNYMREPLGDGLLKRFRDYDEGMLAAIIMGTNPRERSHLLIYNPVNSEDQTWYRLGVDNTYENDGRLSQSILQITLSPSMTEDFMDENGRIAVDRLSSLALRVYRLPGNPPGWGTFEQQYEGETITIARSVGITQRGIVWDVSMDTLARGVLAVTQPFYTPLE